MTRFEVGFGLGVVAFGFEDRAIVGETGEMVWIGLLARPDAEERAWFVIGPDGQLKGRIDLPSGAEVLAVSVDRFALVQRDEMGVEDFQVHAY